MKFTLKAGAELDLLTQKELGAELDRAAGAWRSELSRNVRFPRFSASTDDDGSGTWVIGHDTPDNQTQRLGPAEGFIWSVMRVAVSGGGINIDVDLWKLWISEPSPSRFIGQSFTHLFWDRGAVVLNGGETLYASGEASGGDGSQVVLSGQAIELPIQLAWQLL